MEGSEKTEEEQTALGDKEELDHRSIQGNRAIKHAKSDGLESKTKEGEKGILRKPNLGHIRPL